MLPLLKFLKPYREAGQANALFAPTLFVGRHVFLTKSNALGVVFRLKGIDPACLTESSLESYTRRLAAAWRTFDDRFRLYQYVLKQDHATLDQAQDHTSETVQRTTRARRDHLENRGLYSVQLYLVVLFEPSGSKTATYFSTSNLLRVLASELDANCECLLGQAEALQRSIGDLLGLELLEKAEAFPFFRALANLHQQTAGSDQLLHDSHLDFYMTSSAIAPSRDGLRIGHQNVEVLSLREIPSETLPNVFADLLKVRCNFILCTELRRLPNELAISTVRRAQTHHYWSQWVADVPSLVSMIFSFGKKEDVVADQSELVDVDELSETLKRVKNGGEYLGEFSFTAVLFGKGTRAQLRTAAADFTKIFGAHEGALIQESYNALNAYLSIVPGNGVFNQRRAWLLSGNYADMSLVYAPGAGDPRNRHLGSDATVVLTTSETTPYYFNLYEGKVFGLLIFGAPDMGKSVTTNLLIDHAQKDSPFTFILDLGGSYKGVTAKHGGSYVSLRFGKGQQTFRINPFVLPGTGENLQFLFHFVQSLMTAQGFSSTAQDDRELFEAIQGQYVLPVAHRTLGSLALGLPPRMKPYLHAWISGGQYGSIFDNVEDTITFARFQTFDLTGVDDYPQVLEPLLFYILRRMTQIVQDESLLATPKHLWVDEAWRFLTNETARAAFIEAGKTWRKHNGGLALITQSAHDLECAGILDIVNELCPTKLLLPNPGAQAAFYRDTFKLNEREWERFSELTPKRQFLLKTPSRSAVLNVELDQAAYWTYTNSPFDNVRRDAAIAEHGETKGLELLAANTAR